MLHNQSLSVTGSSLKPSVVLLISKLQVCRVVEYPNKGWQVLIGPIHIVGSHSKKNNVGKSYRLTQ